MKANAGPHTVPSPSYVTKRDDGGTASITTTEVTLSTAPSIKGGDVPKKIDFCLPAQPRRSGASDRLPSVQGQCLVFGWQLFRRGLPASTDIDLVAMHWVDPSPGKATPVYEVRATSAVDGTVTAVARTLTIHNV